MKQANSAKTALTRAIESKVERMDMAGLLSLAQSLNVPIPAAARASRGAERRTVNRPVRPSDTILQGAGIGPVLSAAEGGKRLDAITVENDSADWIASDTAGAVELVERLKISRGTLDNWRKAKKIIALHKGLRNFIYPLRQFEERRPVPGIDAVLPFFSTSEEAWEWLTSPNRMTGDKLPIECLRAGDIGVVTGAAEGAFDYA